MPAAANRAALGGGPDQLDEFQRDALHRKVGRLEPGQGEQVGDETFEVAGLGKHRLAGPLRAIGADDSVGKCLGVSLERGQRRTQLMRDGQQEVALPSLARRQRGGETVDRVREILGLGRRFRTQPYRPVAGRQPSGHRRGIPDRAGETPSEQCAYE